MVNTITPGSPTPYEGSCSAAAACDPAPTATSVTTCCKTDNCNKSNYIFLAILIGVIYTNI